MRGTLPTGREDTEQTWSGRPTPAQTQEPLADDAVPEASRHRHVGLPGLGQDPAEGGQEEEMEEGSDQSAQDLEPQKKTGGQGVVAWRIR